MRQVAKCECARWPNSLRPNTILEKVETAMNEVYINSLREIEVKNDLIIQKNDHIKRLESMIEQRNKKIKRLENEKNN